ncbi:MAG: DnaA regulatory inactivator Hda [Herminiimonas sp.]|nr:DnaA regulatory inactivator Hda [Herminiimonas sp.]
MRQLILNLEAPKPPTLDTFVTGRNAEVLALLMAHSAAPATDLDQRFAYLWGGPGAGKSHLLKALAGRPDARYLDARLLTTTAAIDASLALAPGIMLYLLDNCEQLTPLAQIAAFALFNQVREDGAALITAGSLPPALLALREDLRTRLGWGLIYQVHELSDDEKIEALTRAAELRGLMLSPGVLPYLITHFQRDMRSLSAMVDALDRYSLETQRPITLPLLRSLLQREGDPTA